MWLKITKKQMKKLPLGCILKVNGLRVKLISHYSEADFGFDYSLDLYFDVPSSIDDLGLFEYEIFADDQWENYTVKVEVVT